MPTFYRLTIQCDACRDRKTGFTGPPSASIEEAVRETDKLLWGAGWSHGTGGWFCPDCISQSTSKHQHEKGQP